MITVTPIAAEQIKKSAENSEFVGLPLRITVEGGGCHGYKYRLGFDEPKAGDARFESNGISVVVAQETVPILAGLELDFFSDDDGCAFTFKNPNSPKKDGAGHGAGGCGCGGGGSC